MGSIAHCSDSESNKLLTMHDSSGNVLTICFTYRLLVYMSSEITVKKDMKVLVSKNTFSMIMFFILK